MNALASCSAQTIALLILGASPAPIPDGNASPSPTASPAPQRRACDGPEFHQFDFWVGQWVVRNPAGKEVGSTEISGASGGCAIREQWSSVSGVAGMSMNYYDPADRQWHQDWVGADGTILHLHGGLHDDAMVLSSDVSAQTSNLSRTTWTPLPDGSVKQEWATSSDAGHSWVPIFVGIYTPRR